MSRQTVLAYVPSLCIRGGGVEGAPRVLFFSPFGRVFDALFTQRASHAPTSFQGGEGEESPILARGSPPLLRHTNVS